MAVSDPWSKLWELNSTLSVSVTTRCYECWLPVLSSVVEYLSVDSRLVESLARPAYGSPLADDEYSTCLTTVKSSLDRVDMSDLLV